MKINYKIELTFYHWTITGIVNGFVLMHFARLDGTVATNQEEIQLFIESRTKRSFYRSC